MASSLATTTSLFVWWGLDSECGGMHNVVRASLVVVLLAVLGEGSRRCGVLTQWYLHFSCFSFRLLYHPLFPHLLLLTLPIVLSFSVPALLLDCFGFDSG